MRTRISGAVAFCRARPKTHARYAQLDWHRLVYKTSLPHVYTLRAGGINMTTLRSSGLRFAKRAALSRCLLLKKCTGRLKKLLVDVGSFLLVCLLTLVCPSPDPDPKFNPFRFPHPRRRRTSTSMASSMAWTWPRQGSMLRRPRMHPRLQTAGSTRQVCLHSLCVAQHVPQSLQSPEEQADPREVL